MTAFQRFIAIVFMIAAVTAAMTAETFQWLVTIAFVVFATYMWSTSPLRDEKQKANKMRWASDVPEFKTGDIVYVIDYNRANKRKHFGNGVIKTKVLYASIDLYSDTYCRCQECYKLVWSREYTVSDLFIYYGGKHASKVPSWFVFKTEAEAAELTKWYDVNIGEIEWLEAIGDQERTGPFGTEESELSTYNNNDKNHSEIRSILYNVRDNKGCLEIDRRHLQNLIYESGTCILDDESLTGALGDILIHLELHPSQKKHASS